MLGHYTTDHMNSLFTTVLEAGVTAPVTVPIRASLGARSVAEIKEFMDKPMVLSYSPVHGQNMERAVKEVTRACGSVFAMELMYDFIRAGAGHAQIYALLLFIFPPNLI